MNGNPVFLVAGRGVAWAVVSCWLLCPVRAFWCGLGWAGFNNRKWEAPGLIRLLGTKTRCLAARKEGR